MTSERDMKPGYLRDCETCRAPIYDMRYQNHATVRCCSGKCARALVRQEYPDLGANWGGERAS